MQIIKRSTTVSHPKNNDLTAFIKKRYTKPTIDNRDNDDKKPTTRQTIHPGAKKAVIKGPICQGDSNRRREKPTTTIRISKMTPALKVPGVMIFGWILALAAIAHQTGRGAKSQDALNF